MAAERIIKLTASCFGPAPLLVAVSGGADSVALLHMLWRAGVPCAAAHFDHHTRAGGSTADACFVAGLCARLGLPLYRGGADVAAEARRTGEGYEAAARRLRYAFLCDTARREGFAAIATGHHRDDQAETVLWRMLRGCGTAGLAGIAPETELHGVRVVRPLLDVSRAELREYLRAAGVPWREDASNDDPAHLRNQIRHALLPALARDYNPRIAEALARMAAVQRVDQEYLAAAAAEARARCMPTPNEIDRGAFRALHPALQQRVVLGLAHARAVEPDYARIRAACAFITDAPAGQHFDLGAGVALHSARRGVVLTHGPATLPAEAVPVPVALPLPGVAEAVGLRFRARLLREVPASPADYCTPHRQLFDADALGDALHVRTRRPGDRFAPLGLGGHKKLKAYLSERGVPRLRRDAVALLEAGGRIVWVVGHAPSAEGAIGPQTRRIAEIEAEPCA